MLKHVSFILITLFFAAVTSCAQTPETQFENFGDISSITQPNQAKWQSLKNDLTFSVVSLNSRVAYNSFPYRNTATAVNLQGWIGEEVNEQLVISTRKNIESLKIEVGNLTSNNGNTINSEHCKVGFVYYVLADNSLGVCHKDPNTNYGKIIMPDIVDFDAATSFAKSFTNRPVLFKIKIPADAVPGVYTGKITASGDGVSKSINITLKVSANKMPAVANRKFFLELWQYPLTEADFYKVKPWSDEHFSLMKPAMIKLRDAGEDVITASFFWDQFNPKAKNADDMYIKVVKSKSGEWSYDFTNFDKWVSFMMGLGIKKQITVFGMATLNYRMYYFDAATDSVVYFQQGINGAQYRQFWSSYLKAFDAHLREKGWFDITTLGFSEKDPDVAIPLIKFIKSQDKDWKISYSGKYFQSIQADVYDYGLISNQEIPDEVLAQRKNKGFITTFYTSCWEKFPNTFVMSNPIDASWLGWNAANRNLNGFLRWAYDYWTPKILTDVTTNVASGDNFFIYPNGYSSMRFEMLKDGIEDYEKINIKKSQSNFSPQFNSTLSQFDFKKVSAAKDRSLQVENARQSLDN